MLVKTQKSPLPPSPMTVVPASSGWVLYQAQIFNGWSQSSKYITIESVWLTLHFHCSYQPLSFFFGVSTHLVATNLRKVGL